MTKTRPGTQKLGSVRIIAGTWRGRTIDVPAGEAVRPTSDRVREALFNRLVHGFSETGFRLPGAKVVDVFAGTGALGLEALSRGAAHATFIEQNLDIAKLLRRNVEKLGAEDKVTILSADGAHLPRAANAHDLALIDPPYGDDLSTQALHGLTVNEWLRNGALVSLETGSDEIIPKNESLELLDRRAYGRSSISIFQFTPP